MKENQEQGEEEEKQQRSKERNKNNKNRNKEEKNEHDMRAEWECKVRAGKGMSRTVVEKERTMGHEWCKKERNES